MEKMTAAVRYQYGDASKISVAKVDRPSPKDIRRLVVKMRIVGSCAQMNSLNLSILLYRHLYPCINNYK